MEGAAAKEISMTGNLDRGRFGDREKGRKGSNKCEFTEDTQRTNETYGNAGGNGNQAPGMHCTADG